MAQTRKRAPGGGRKPKGEAKGMGDSLTIRLTSETRALLEKDAARTGWSLSQTVEKRLRERLTYQETAEANYGPPNTRALAFCVARVARLAELKTDRKWNQDRFTFEMVRAGVGRLLDLLASDLFEPGDIETPDRIKAARDNWAANWPTETSIHTQLSTPSGVADAIVLGLFDQIRLAAAPPPPPAAGDRYADEYFQMPRVKADLGLGAAKRERRS